MRHRSIGSGLFAVFLVALLACSSASPPPPRLPAPMPAATEPAQPIASAKAPASTEAPPAPVYLWADTPSAPAAVPTTVRRPLRSAPPDWLALITPSADPGLPGQVLTVRAPSYPEKPPPGSPPPPDEERWRKSQHIMYRVRRCYKDALAIRPDLGGGVRFQVVAGPDGLVRSATVKSSTINDSTLENCILALLRELEFEPYDGYPTLVIPMMFMPPAAPSEPTPGPDESR